MPSRLLAQYPHRRRSIIACYVFQLRGWHVMTHNDACDGLAPASFTVRKSDAVAFGGMYALAIASPIPASSTLPDLQTIFQLRGWHETTHTVLVHQYQTGSYFVAEPGEPIFVPSIYSSKRNSGSVGVSRYQAFSFIPQRRVHDQCDGPKLRVGPSSPRAVITGVNSCSSFNLVQSGRYVKSLA